MPEALACRRGVSALGLVSLAVLAAFSSVLGAAPTAGRISFEGSIKEVPVGAPASRPHRVRDKLTATELAETLDFVVSLRMRNFDELEARIHSGQAVSQSEMGARYLPMRSDYDKVASWLKSQGFTLTLNDPNRTDLFARGTIAQISAALGAKFARVSAGGGEFTSTVTAPTLPEEIAAPVLGIDGLQPHLLMRRPRARSESITNVGGYYTPADIAAAYGFPAAFNGSGQTIAIIMCAAPAGSDIGGFWSACGINDAYTTYSTIPIMGGPTGTSQTNGVSEVTLDCEWATGMAPGAKLRIYEIPSLLTSYLVAACTQILADAATDPSITVASYSAAGPESDYPQNTLMADSQKFALLANANITFLAASGDGGSNPNPVSQGDGYSSANALTVEYPASDPNVTAAGGTTVNFDSGWTATGETAWTPGAAGTGGGISGAFSRPIWQTGTGFPSGAQRCVPDVAAVANASISAFGTQQNNIGAFMVLGGGYFGGGGTSLSSPVWAGIVAIMNSARSNLGLTPLGLLGHWIYPLIGTNAFRDITTGNNGAYGAGVGYDLCTGIGTPNVTNLIAGIDEEITFTGPPTSPINAGTPVAMTATAQLPATYQWKLNGANIPGATSSTYSIAKTVVANNGVYSVVITSSLGSFTYVIGTLTINATSAPAFTLAASPATVTVASGRSVAFNTIATGAPAPTYQWTLNTVPISGATDPILLVSGATSANAGTYTCTATNSQGSVSTSATLTVITSSTPGYLTNLSSRAVVGTGANILIAGFGISGTGAMDLLVRGGGPTLAAPPYNGTGYITTPQLTLFDTVIPTDPQPIVTNVAWGSPFTLGTSTVNVSPQMATTALFDTVGAYHFNLGSADSAIEVTPPAGNYTAQISGVSGVTGIVLAELYDADPYTPNTKLVNISTRASVGTGANILIGGFVIGGTTAETLLIRAIGPTLTQPPYNGTGYITNPQLTLYAGSTPVYSNTNWADDATISAAFGTVGAFPLNPTSADSVLLVTLPPANNYTAQVSGVNNGTGIALMEIYEVR